MQQQEIEKLLKSYDIDKLTVGVLGGHSALDVCAGAKKYGFKTLVVAQKGREKTYSKYFKRRDAINRAGDVIGCVDELMTVEKFSDILQKKNQDELRKHNTIFIHSRYFWVYFDDFEKVEKEFNVPIFG